MLYLHSPYNPMDIANLNSLKKSLVYLGFGNSLTPALEAKIKSGSNKFSIGATAQFDNEHFLQGNLTKDVVHYELLFSKVEEIYSINGFKATLEKGNADDRISNTFFLGKGNDLTAKEAYNLLSGRSILKEVEISKQYDLQLVNSQGLVVQETKVAGIQEAKDFLSLKKNSVPYEQGSLKILDYGHLIRQLDLKGNDITPEPSTNVILVHDYFKEGIRNKSHYFMRNREEAIDMMQRVLHERDPDQFTNGFLIYESTGKHLLYNFDKDGREIDLSLHKRRENIWIKLDFQQKDKNGNYGFHRIYEDQNFNLEKELNLLKVSELSNENQKRSLMASLGRGNIQSAILESGERVFLKADPWAKKIEVYDLRFSKLEIDPRNKDYGFKR